MRQKLYEVTIGVFLENGKISRDKFSFSEEIKQIFNKKGLKFKTKKGKVKNVDATGGWFTHSDEERNEVFKKLDDKLAPRVSLNELEKQEAEEPKIEKVKKQRRKKKAKKEISSQDDLQPSEKATFKTKVKKHRKKKKKAIEELTQQAVEEINQIKAQ